MKWLLVLLFALNVSLGLLQWFKAREQAGQSHFQDSDAIASIMLLGKQMSASESRERCLLVGPLQGEAKSEQLLSVLVVEGVKAELIRKKVDKAPGYWVYFGPFANANESLAQLREFHSKSIDSFIIRNGELKGNISLGVFENIDSARRMKKIMKRNGYETKMREIEKSEDEFWVLISGSNNGGDFSRSTALLKGLSGVPEMRQIFCKSVASEK